MVAVTPDVAPRLQSHARRRPAGVDLPCMKHETARLPPQNPARQAAVDSSISPR